MSQSRRPLIAGNWKMYKNRAEAKAFVEELAQQTSAEAFGTVDLAVACSFTLLDTVKATAEATQAPLHVAAQTMEHRQEGAYTGEVSPRMLAELDLYGVVLGHSERRQYFNENDEALKAKVAAALEAKLVPIFCLGETLEQREAGSTDQIVLHQLNVALEGLAPEQLARVVVAYEPVWAIGTGKVCDSDEANRVCALIRGALAKLADEATAQQIRILYGGSMKPENAEELLAKSDIDGGLIGGASLKVDSFLAIAEAGAKLAKAANACSV